MEIHDQTEIITILSHRLKNLSKAIDKDDLVEIDTTWFNCKVAWENLIPKVKQLIQNHEQNKEPK